MLTIAVDNREKRKLGNLYPLLLRGTVKYISENKQAKIGLTRTVKKIYTQT